MQGWKLKTFVFLVSQGVTLLGSSIVQFALVWYITMESSSGFWVASLSLCAFLPQFAISLFSGVWADRYNRKLLIIASDAFIAAATLGLALLLPLLKTNASIFPALLLVSVIRSFGTGVQVPAVSAMIPQLVDASHLMRFNALNATLQSAVQFASPFIAGFFLSFLSLRSTLFLDVGTAVGGISLLAILAVPKLSSMQAEEKSSLLRDIAEGLAYARKQRWVARMLSSYALFIFLTVPAGFLATLFVTRTYQQSYLYMTMVEVVGFLGMSLGGLLMSLKTMGKNGVKTLLAGMTAFGLLAIGMGVIDSFVVYLSLMLLYGIALTMVQTSTITLLQQHTPAEVQGRVFGFLQMMFSGALPLGMLTFGPLADRMSMRLLMASSGVLLLVLALVLRFDWVFTQPQEATPRPPHQP